MDDLLRPLFSTHPDIVYCTDLSGRTTFANAAAARFFGLPAGTSDAVKLTRADRKALLGAAFVGSEQQALSSGEIGFAEYPQTQNHGTPAWYGFQFTSIRDAQGSVAGLFVQGRDITNLRSAEAALEKREGRWNAALEIAGQGVWESDLEQGVMYYSSTWKLMRGMAAGEEVTGPPGAWLGRVHPDDRKRVAETVRRQDHGQVERRLFEYRERHRDGHWMWVSSLSGPVEWGPDGKPKRIVGTDTDITHRKAAEEQLARLSRRLELALEVSKIGVFESDIRSGQLFWDDRLMDLFGKPRDTGPLSALDWETSLHPDDAAKAKSKVAKAIEAKRPFTLEFRIIRSDGEIRHMRSRAMYYQDAGASPKFVGCCWDVTADVQLNETLERAKNLAEARNLEIEAAKALTEYDSLHDALTGLPNRRYLDQTLKKHAEACATTGGGVSLLHIDLDRFKQINDTLGHSAGDSMLVHVANLLLANAGPKHFVARVGGDEFILVCLFEAKREQLSALAEKIIAQVRQPVPFEGHLCRFGASVGIAIAGGADIDSNRLLINADIALYRAKGSGRNRYEFFSDELQAEITTTKQIADDILRGIEQSEFLPHYQPLFDARTHNVVGVEALVRWNHPTQGMLAPAAFLKIAEDLNVVATIDSLMLEQALADFSRWNTLGFALPSISVNVSFRRLHDQELITNLKGLHIPKGTVSFELLESIFLDEIDPIVAWNIDQIRELGISIDIDDFGTGHASIVSLLKLSPRRFKIDRQFVTPIAESPEQRKLVGSIIDIGKSLGIAVVAEGVETMQQAAILGKLGCDILQGYAFARPMPAAEMETFLRQQNLQKVS